MTVRTALGFAAMLMVSILGLGGCGGPVRYDINVTRDDAIKDMSVQVDLIGVNNPTALDAVMTCDINKYWAADGATRSANRYYPMQFVAGGANAQSVSREDPIWEKWNTPDTMVVVALIPGVGGEKGADRRRIKLSLQSGDWKDRTLEIRVDSKGLNVLTPGKGGY